MTIFKTFIEASTMYSCSYACVSCHCCVVEDGFHKLYNSDNFILCMATQLTRNVIMWNIINTKPKP